LATATLRSLWRQVEAGQVGDDGVVGENREEFTDARLECRGIPLGDVVRADRDRDDVGLEPGESGQLVAYRKRDGGARDAEIDNANRAAGGQADVVGQDADVAAVRCAGTDALSRAVTDGDVEQLALHLGVVAPPLSSGWAAFHSSRPRSRRPARGTSCS